MSARAYYQDDLVTLYHGDCREVLAWLDADVLVTDPPYGMDFRSSWTTENRPIEGDETTGVRDDVLALWRANGIADKRQAERPWLMFGTWRVEKPAATRQVLVWDKAGAGPGMGDLALQFGTSHEEIYLSAGWTKQAAARRGSVIRTNGSPGALTRDIGHPTPKPIALLELLIAHAPAGVIADPFSGSGSTAVAAKRLGRRYIGVELDERYCEIAARRLDQGVLDFGEEAS